MGTRRALLLASASLMGVRRGTRTEMLGENRRALSSASPTDTHPPWTMTLLCCPTITLIRMITQHPATITQPSLPLQSTGTATITTSQTPHPSHHPSHPHPRPSNNNNNSSPLHTYPPAHQRPPPCKLPQNPHSHHNHPAHPSLTHPLPKSSYPTHRPTSP
jgi:hypothetical protein